MKKIYRSLLLVTALMPGFIAGQEDTSPDKLEMVFRLLTEEANTVFNKLNETNDMKVKMVQRMRLLVVWRALLPLQQVIMEAQVANRSRYPNLIAQVEQSLLQLDAVQELVSAAKGELVMAGLSADERAAQQAILDGLSNQITLRRGYLDSVLVRLRTQPMITPPAGTPSVGVI